MARLADRAVGVGAWLAAFQPSDCPNVLTLCGDERSTEDGLGGAGGVWATKVVCIAVGPTVKVAAGLSNYIEARRDQEGADYNGSCCGSRDGEATFNPAFTG